MGTLPAEPNRTQTYGSRLGYAMVCYGCYGVPAQDRDLTALRRAARRLADSNESGATGFGADGAAGESKVDKVDTFRRCVLTYPEEIMFCMVKVTKNHPTHCMVGTRP